MNIKNIAHSIGKVILDPGVVFPIANIFAFLTTGNHWAVGGAMTTAVVAGAASYARVYPQSRFSTFFKNKKHLFPKFLREQFAHPLRINAWGVLVPTLITAGAALAVSLPLAAPLLTVASTVLSSGNVTATYLPALAIAGYAIAIDLPLAAVLPMIAGTVFSSGSFTATSNRCNRIQKDPHAKGWVKAVLSPAVHWSIGYAALGLMAGGGMNLLMHPLSNIPALIMTTLGIATTTSSTIGLTLKKFSNPASPFMTLVHGTGINALVAAVTANPISVINMTCAGIGEFRVGQIVHGEQAALQPSLPQADVKEPRANTNAVNRQGSLLTSAFKAAANTVTSRINFHNFEYLVDWPLRLVDHINRPTRAEATPK